MKATSKSPGGLTAKILRFHRQRGSLLLLLSALAAAACNTTNNRILKEPVAIELRQPLASTSDATLSATLDWVIVRDGPGTWSSNANWDEYMLRIENLSTRAVRIQNVTVRDSQGQVQQPSARRQGLIDASRDVVTRYNQDNIDVVIGSGVDGLSIATGAVALAGSYAGTYAAYGSAAGLSVATGALILMPVLVLSSATQGVDNMEVSRELIARQTALPAVIGPGATETLSLFFPIAPSPQDVKVIYRAQQSVHQLSIDTRAPLNGLHIRSAGNIEAHSDNEDKH